MKLPVIEIIESITPDPNLMMWKYAQDNRALYNGAQLTVRESQHAMLMYEGQVADVFAAGRHQLSTSNIPVLSQIMGWKHGFESPYLADIYFFNTHPFLNNKWGTPAPIMMKDNQFGQIRIKAFGSYDLKIVDAATFFRQYCGTYVQLTIFELQRQLRDYIAPIFGEILAQAQISVVEVASNVSVLSLKVHALLRPYFEQLGLELLAFTITSVSLPDEVSAFYDKITHMNMVQDMNKFTQFQAANALGDSQSAVHQAHQSAITMGVMTAALQTHVSSNTAGATTNQGNQASKPDAAGRLQQLKSIFVAGLITEQEFAQKKEQILSEL